MIVYEQFKEINDNTKKSLKGNPFNQVLKIDSVDFSKDTCEIQGKTYKIKVIVQHIVDRKGCISNPSILTNWKGFNEEKDKNEIKSKKFTRAAVEHKLKCNFSKYTYYGLLLDSIAVVKVDKQLGVFDLNEERYLTLKDFSDYTQESALRVVIVNNMIVSYTLRGVLTIYRFKNIDDIAKKIVQIPAKRITDKCSVLQVLNERFVLVTGYAYTAILDLETAQIYIDNNYYISVMYEESSDINYNVITEKINCDIKPNSVIMKVRLTSEFNRDYTRYKWPMKKGYTIQFGIFMDGRPLQVAFYDDKKQKTEAYYCKDINDKIKIEKKG